MESGSQLRDVLSKRRDVLESICGEPKTKPELVDDLGRSRSTIDRAVLDLRTVDCIEPTEADRSRFRCTPTGKLLLQAHREYCADSESLQRCAPVLNSLPPGVEISKTFVSTAELYSSTKTPDIALQPAIDLLPGATKLTGTAPVVFGDYFDVLIEWMQTGESEMELVLEQDLLESIVTNYADEFTDLTSFGSIDLYVHDGRIPYALWMIEREPNDHAGLTVYENGGIMGTLVTDSDRAIRWARKQYDRYKTDSSELEVDSLGNSV